MLNYQRQGRESSLVRAPVRNLQSSAPILGCQFRAPGLSLPHSRFLAFPAFYVIEICSKGNKGDNNQRASGDGHALRLA